MSRDVLQIGIWSDIGWIISTKFQVDGDGASAHSLTDSQATNRRSGEADEAELGKLDELPEGLGIAGLDDLENILGQTGLVEDVDEVLADERCLR